MIVTLKQNDLFQLMKSEKYVIDNTLIIKTKLLIEKSTSRPSKEIFNGTLKQLVANYKILRKRWKQLNGGPKRAFFLDNNLKKNFTLKILN